MKANGKKILLVDDEEDVVDFLGYTLRNDGFEVITASNGLEALRQAKTHLPDLIVLDIMMPKMDGIQTCRELRSMPMLKNTLIVFLSAREEDSYQITGFEFGADDFINKPIKPRVFISRINALLRRKQGEAGNELIKAGTIEIDRESYLVRNEKSEFVLPKKEFELLCLFVSKPGKVFKRDDILSAVWGHETEVGERTIDVHIRRLRKKLGSDHFYTIKGVGYKFEG